jgi:hypothetical protein
MGLEKAIKSGKEHRKSYKERGKSGEHDVSCRPHGGGHDPCPYCDRNRKHKHKKRELLVDYV